MAPRKKGEIEEQGTQGSREVSFTSVPNQAHLGAWRGMAKGKEKRTGS